MNRIQGCDTQRYKALFSGAATAGALLLLPATVQAKSMNDEKASAVEEVVVTASRRAERLLDVPMAVTAVSKNELMNAGAATTRDLTQLAPGFTGITNGKVFQPAIRGVSSASGQAGEEQNIALYIDNVYMAAATGNVFSLKNIDQVEVLKGPQGTLFGRNATGGAVRVMTRDPGQTRELNFSASYGTELKSKEYTAFASTALTDTLAMNISASVYDDEGYIRSLIPGWKAGKFGQTHSWNSRLKLAWRPTDDIKVVLAFDMGRYQSDTAFSLSPVAGIASTRNQAGYIAADAPYTIANNLKPTVNNRTSGVSLNLNYDRPTFGLQSTTAYRTNSLHSLLDSDRTNFLTGSQVSADSMIWVTQEFLYTSRFDGPFNLIAGAFYFRGDADSNSIGVANGPITTPDGGLVSLGTRISQQTLAYVKTKSGSAFADGSYEVSDKFKVLAGIRYTTETKDLMTVPVVTPLPRVIDKDTWNNVSVRLTGQYHFNDDLNVYATYSTGFKSGTYNGGSRTEVQKAFPEEVEAFEVGLKGRLLGRTDVAISAFHYDYTNIQVSQTTTVGTLVSSRFANAGTARMYGMETELTTFVTDNLRFKVGAAWLPKADYTKYLNGLDSVPRGHPGSLEPSLCPGPNCGLGVNQIVRDISGTRIIRAPKVTVNLNAAYEREFAGGQLELMANYFYSSKLYRYTGAHISEPSYSVVNATAAWWTPSKKVRFSVWGRNLADEFYGLYQSVNATGLSSAPAAPREIGFSIDYVY